MGSLLPGWRDSGLPPKGFREEEETASPSYRTGSRRNSLSRVSAPGLARTSPQPVSPRTPSKSLSAKEQHWAPSLPAVADEKAEAAKAAADEESQRPTRWWTKVDSGFHNDKVIEEVPADWKTGSYKPQVAVARDMAGLSGSEAAMP